jgi:hypothetical protein
MLESQLDQEERRRVLANDASVRRQQRERGSTYLDHVEPSAGGRFAVIDQPTVVGSTAIPQYPQASTPFQRDPVPDEPPLGLDNPALELEPLGPPEAQALGPTSAPTPLGVGGSLSRNFRRLK